MYAKIKYTFDLSQTFYTKQKEIIKTTHTTSPYRWYKRIMYIDFKF